MNQFDGLNIAYLVGCLILVGSALAAYKLSWKRSVVYLLMWGSIFAVVTLIINMVR